MTHPSVLPFINIKLDQNAYYHGGESTLLFSIFVLVLSFFSNLFFTSINKDFVTEDDKNIAIIFLEMNGFVIFFSSQNQIQPVLSKWNPSHFYEGNTINFKKWVSADKSSFEQKPKFDPLKNKKMETPKRRQNLSSSS